MCNLAGIFVGGRARRMEGYPKGLLLDSEGRTLVERWRALWSEYGIPCVLVGAAAPYQHLGLEIVADETPDVGPLGGLAALLARVGRGQVIAVACDMPYVSSRLAGRLAAFPAQHAVVAPRQGGIWDPLFARYDAERVLPLARARIRAQRLSLQGLLDEAGAQELPLDDHERRELRDWDSFDDVRSG